MDIRPNAQEINFLNHSYDFFLDVFDEINNENFWGEESYYRLSRIRDAFLIYSEVLEYEPFGWFLEELKEKRPPMESELSKEYLLFIRNLLVHFPFFKSWNEVKFSKSLINWSRPGKSIDKFLRRFKGHQPVKYRMWNPKSKKMTYLSINFPSKYMDGEELWLKDFMPEKEGILFSMSLMHRVLMSQVESIKET